VVTTQCDHGEVQCVSVVEERGLGRRISSDEIVDQAQWEGSMGPLNLNQLLEKLMGQHTERKLAELGQLWEAFGLRGAFLESTNTNALTATVVGDTGVGPLKEVGGMFSLQLTPYAALTGLGVRERPESSQLIMAVGDKEFHLPWPGTLEVMLADEVFQWIMRRWREVQGM
jgi:hypothetical protein